MLKIKKFFIFFPVSTGYDGRYQICKAQCGRTISTITGHLKCLRYFLRKIVSKQKHEIFNILGPAVTTKRLIDNYLTHFILNKIWRFHENRLNRFWENVTEKKIMIRWNIVTISELPPPPKPLPLSDTEYKIHNYVINWRGNDFFSISKTYIATFNNSAFILHYKILFFLKLLVIYFSSHLL